MAEDNERIKAVSMLCGVRVTDHLRDLQTHTFRGFISIQDLHVLIVVGRFTFIQITHG